MKLKRMLYGAILILLIMAGCNSHERTTTVTTFTTANVDAEEVLTTDPTADIFQFNGIIYETNIDWVNELTLTKDIQVGEIK